MSKELDFQSNGTKFENADMKKWSSLQSTNDMQRQCRVFLLKCREEMWNSTKSRRPKWKLPMQPLTWHIITAKDCEESPPSWWLIEVPTESEYKRIADMVHPTIRQTFIEPFHLNSTAGQLVCGLSVCTYHQPDEQGRTVGMVSLRETSLAMTTKLKHAEDEKVLLFQKLIESFIFAGIVSKWRFLASVSGDGIFKERAGIVLPTQHCIRALIQGFQVLLLMIEWTFAINGKQDSVHSFISKLFFHSLSQNSKLNTLKLKKMIGEDFEKCKIPKLLKSLWKWTDRLQVGYFSSRSIQAVQPLFDQLNKAVNEDDLKKADGDLCLHVCNASEALLQWIQSAVQHPWKDSWQTGMPDWLDAEVKKLMLNQDNFPVENIQATCGPVSVRTVGVSVDPLMFAEEPDEHLLIRWTLETDQKLSSSDNETLETISQTMKTQGEKLQRIARRKSRKITNTVGSLASTETDSDQLTRLTLEKLHQYRKARPLESIVNVEFLSNYHQLRPTLNEDHHHHQSSKDANVCKKSPTTGQNCRMKFNTAKQMNTNGKNGLFSRKLKFSNNENQQQLQQRIFGNGNKIAKRKSKNVIKIRDDGDLINYEKTNFHNAFVDNFLRDMVFFKFDDNNQVIIRSLSEKANSSSSSSMTTSSETHEQKIHEEEEKMKKQ
ncbi:hypothetical protein T4B_11413 [Trichinella pseudospiralis]|uniref:Uncharacterized protein n=2 Tax=Trichinella pseudospiralis TaxID=6337 RepID=A0A0V1G1Y2_TRIPS|nr:hypothetical protein T4A_7390 [Trichinella pseudospiralis]KRY92344.1 hypothetical protein T4D_958 [Trichinella pseudospiralis]KRZ24422.1 hypothetical protein T4B_11413 [Trichinella pseudospiralis]KRZ46204.1 hypothetical protein T4C_2817 [Trichinella pseudospiralis]